MCVICLYISLYIICACSSVDRASASGAESVGSIPIRRTRRGIRVIPIEYSVFLCLIFKCGHYQTLSNTAIKTRQKSAVQKFLSYFNTSDTKSQGKQLYTIIFL